MIVTDDMREEWRNEELERLRAEVKRLEDDLLDIGRSVAGYGELLSEDRAEIRRLRAVIHRAQRLAVTMSHPESCDAKSTADSDDPRCSCEVRQLYNLLTPALLPQDET